MKEMVCILCHSSERRLVCAGTDRDSTLDNRVYYLYQCRVCGLVYLSPRPDTPRGDSRDISVYLRKLCNKEAIFCHDDEKNCVEILKLLRL
jgi:hypothetical protein